MSFKSPAFFASVAIVCGVLLFILNRPWFGMSKSRTPEPGAHLSGEACAILIVDESENDRFIREKLFSNGLGEFISESSQIVPIDDFGTFKFIPLDSFHNEIETFDPRDNGYAAKLRSFFIHEGKRFFLSLLNDNSRGIHSQINSTEMKKKLDAILGNIPYTFVILGRGESMLFNFILMLTGCSIALFFSRSRRLYVFQVPVLLSIAYCGFYAMILAAILTGIWELLREPLGELSATMRYNRILDYAGAGFKGIRSRLKPYKINFFLVFVFMLFFLIFSFSGILSPLMLVSVGLSFSFLYFLSFLVEAEIIRRRSHIPFTPVLLLTQRAKTFSLFPCLLPFGLISLIALFLPRGVSEVNPIDPGYFVSTEEYNRHTAFQRSFSFRSLNQEPDIYDYNALMHEDYLRYYLGEDGLIAGTNPHSGFEEEALPFPLEKLMDFLIEYNKLAVGDSAGKNTPLDTSVAAMFKEWISVVIIFAVCLLDFLKPQIAPKKKHPLIWDKRIAA